EHKPCIVVIGSNAGQDGVGFNVDAPNVTIQGLAIVGWDYAGIAVGQTGTNAKIIGNFIGTELGTTSAPNGQGIYVDRASGVTIGGSTAASRNVISGNDTHAILLSSASGTSILGNYIGTDADGIGAMPNHPSQGIYAGAVNIDNSPNTTLGGA